MSDEGASEESPSATPPPLGERRSWVRERLAAAPRLSVCLDFDGTLAPIVDSPADATMREDVREPLAALARRTGVDVAVVSGRTLSDLRDRVPVEGCALAGNHGLEIGYDDERWVHPGADVRPALERAMRAVEEALADAPGCRIEDKGVTATVHHRGAGVDHETVRAAVEAALADEADLRATDGRRIVELRPTVAWDKADAVRELTDDDAVALVVGDDVTDEDAFRALEGLANGGVGVLVGERPSAADVRVPDVEAVRDLLAWLAAADLPAAAGRSSRAGSQAASRAGSTADAEPAPEPPSDGS